MNLGELTDRIQIQGKIKNLAIAVLKKILINFDHGQQKILRIDIPSTEKR